MAAAKEEQRSSFRSVTIRSPLRLVSSAVLAALLLATAGAAWTTHLVVRDQERRLLTQRTAEVALALSDSIDALPGPLTDLGGILRASGGSVSEFDRAAQSASATGPT